MSAYDDLQDVIDDPSATRNERDAAQDTIKRLQARIPPSPSSLDVLRGYVAKKYAVDRYGK